MEINKLHHGDVLEVLATLPDESIDCIVTSPPYYALRNYGTPDQLGLEPTIQEYIQKISKVFAELKRVLKPTGSLWLNIGDTWASRCKGSGGTGKMGDDLYARLKARAGFEPVKFNMGMPDRALCMIPERLSLALWDIGLIPFFRCIWHKPNARPFSGKRRFNHDYEFFYFFGKTTSYYFEMQYEPHKTKPPLNVGIRRGLIKGPTQLGREQRSSGNVNYHPNGRLKRAVWTIASQQYKEAHGAAFPEKLVICPIQAGCPVNGVVLDPFIGIGTTAVMAKRLGRNYIGIDNNLESIKIAEKRIEKEILKNNG